MALEMLGSVLLCIAAVAVALEASSGRISPGAVGLALSYALNMPRQLMWISIYMAQLETELVAVERVAQYIRLAQEHDAVTTPTFVAGTSIAAGVDDGLMVREAWFQYSIYAPWILQDLSFSLPAGTRAAVVGRTGSGKSSVITACLRLYPLARGQIFVHGQNASSMSLTELRGMVRVLLQDPIIFSGTVRSNIFVSRSLAAADAILDDAIFWKALEAAGLAEFVRSLGGLDTLVEEAGSNFSQGQRQLICMARTLLDMPDIATVPGWSMHPRCILCDEPTSSCDTATDAMVHTILLEGLPRHWTLAVVCHRLHRIASFDTVLVMHAGKVVESGPPQLLLKNTNDSPSSMLRQMCVTQGCL